MEYSGWGSSWATMARPMAMMAATMPSVPPTDSGPAARGGGRSGVGAQAINAWRTCCPSQTRTSVCLSAVMVGQLLEAGLFDVGVPAQRAAANVVNRRRPP
jgi:hypothetical protein